MASFPFPPLHRPIVGGPLDLTDEAWHAWFLAVAAQLPVPSQRSTAFIELTDAATIAIDASLGDNFFVTLAGDRTLGNPTNLSDGQILTVWVYQDGTGTHTLGYESKYKWPKGRAPTVSALANDLTVLTFQYRAAADILAGAYLLDES